MMSNPGDFCVQIKEWWRRIPLFSMSIFYFTLFLFLISFIGLFSIDSFILFPSDFITYFYIWEIFTFQYFNNSIISYLFQIFSYLPTSCKSEREMSTVTYICFFLMNNIIIGVIYVLLMELLSNVNVSFLIGTDGIPTYGLWPVLITEIVIRCNKNPDALTRFCMIPCEFKQKFYPWVIFALFSLFSQFVMYDLIVGMMVGYLRKIYLDVYRVLKFTVISDETAKKIELGYCSCIRNFTRFAPVGGSSREIENNAPLLPVRNEIRPFAGQGYRLG